MLSVKYAKSLERTGDMWTTKPLLTGRKLFKEGAEREFVKKGRGLYLRILQEQLQR